MDKRWEKEGLRAEEYDMIVDILKREPTNAELGMYGVMWSEHCSYKNSKPVLKKFPVEGERVMQGPGENAGVIDIGDGLAVSFKIESHNHPSAIEPYEGAATGVGGILRDIFTMGARPIASLNSLYFGELDDEHVKFLFDGVVAGIAGYGNCIGVPTVGGEVHFSSAYKGNPLVNAMSVGIMEHKDIATATASGAGNSVMVVGATTGRDGIQGASFASDELSEDSEEDRPAVQVGDPFMEKLLLEASLELIRSGAIVGIQDMGAAGLTGSSCEMASRGNSGIELDLDLVPVREEGMTPYEILLSESQERMLVVPKKGKEELVKRIFEKWELNAAIVGKVTDDGLLKIKKDGKIVAKLPAKSLADDAPVYKRESRKPAYLEDADKFNTKLLDDGQDYNEVLLKMISSPGLANKEWVYEQYDHMVRTNTVVLPGSDAAVLRVKESKKGLAITTDSNGRYAYLNPERAGMIVVAEAARNLVCSGAEPLAITDGMNFGNPMNPEVFWQFEKSAEGISRACKVFNTPVTGGNVSFYNESPEAAIYPTPIIGMVGLLEDIKNATTHDFKDEEDLIILLGESRSEMGGSEYLKVMFNEEKGEIPEINLEFEKNVQKLCMSCINKGFVKSAHDCSDGGLAVNIAESCMDGDIGAEINIDSRLSDYALLFSESQSRIVISINKENLESFQGLADEFEVPWEIIGEVKSNKLKINDLVDLEIKELKERWKGSIRKIME